MISLISLSENINVFVSKLRYTLWIPASAADAAVVNPNGIKWLWANGASIFLINGNPVFVNCEDF